MLEWFCKLSSISNQRFKELKYKNNNGKYMTTVIAQFLPTSSRSLSVYQKKLLLPVSSPDFGHRKAKKLRRSLKMRQLCIPSLFRTTSGLPLQSPAEQNRYAHIAFFSGSPLHPDETHKGGEKLDIN